MATTIKVTQGMHTPGRGVAVRPGGAPPRRPLSASSASARNPISVDGGRVIKRYSDLECLRAELAAYRRLADSGVVPRLLSSDDETIELQYCGSRLEALDPSDYPSVDDVFAALAGVHAMGIAHGDLHGRNVLVDSCGRVRVIDFEWCADDDYAPLRDAYDLVGPARSSVVVDPTPGGMFWDRDHPLAMMQLFGVTAAEAYDRYVARLRDRARLVSGPGRHGGTRDGRPYQSFSHPLFSLSDAQRDTARRIDAWGVDLTGRSVLDLGSNIGAVSLACIQRGAASVTGIEGDSDRVDVARRIAAVCGLHHRVSFRRKSIEAYLPVATQHDVVLVLAVDAWVDAPETLYRAVARVARSTIIIESNRPHSERRTIPPLFSSLGWSVEEIGDTQSEDAYGIDRTIFRCTR